MKTVATIAVRFASVKSASLSCCRQRIRCAAVGVRRRLIAIAAQRSAEK
jgi:hypothetical protein